MKSRQTILLILFFLSGLMPLNAGRITPGQASRVARNLMTERAPTASPGNPGMSYLQDTRFWEGEPLFYIMGFSAMPGFVIVSAIDGMIPVAGYSFSGSYSPENQPPAFSAWMQKLELQARLALTADRQNTALPHPSWNHYLAEPFLPGDQPADAGPMLTTKWGQGCFYNASCPTEPSATTTCLHTPAGCGAIAMAQVMKFYNYPVHGTGEHGYQHASYGIQYANFGSTTYNWASMTDTVLANNDAVATLIYQCGVSQDMNYGVTLSTSNSEKIDAAFKTYFGYSSSASWKWKQNFTAAAWLGMVKAEIDAGRPLYYYGNNGGSDGHFFICDGYQGADYFHFNWGWNGEYDGYFYLDNLTPGILNFNDQQGAIFDLSPSNPGPTGFTQDFESVGNFSLTFDPWTALDVDGHTTYSIQGHTFPHAGEAMAFICFNPSQTAPPMTDEPIQPHGGQKFGACFSSDPPSNDDWFITPQVQLGTSGEFSFWVKSYTAEYGLEKYRVAISTTDNNPSSFTYLSGPAALEAPVVWTRKNFNLSGYNNQKVYLAIQCVSNNAFILMIDDLEVKATSSGSLTANFSADKTVARVGEGVNFYDQSTGVPTTWAWTFHGGTPATSTDQNPANIKYNAPGTYDVTLTVGNGSSSDTEVKSGYIRVTSSPSSMTLDFEGVADFSLDFSPWTVADVRGGATWGIQGVDFPHSGSEMAYICFNPSATTPALTNMVAHSGQKLGCCFSSMPNKNPNDKWLITPKLSLGADPRIEFWVQSYNINYGFELYNVAVSTTTNQPSSFTNINVSPISAPATWTHRSYDLAAYSNQDVYIGIQCVSDNAFIFMIDDIAITSTVGIGESAAGNLLSVYPNPAREQVKVKFGSAGHGSADLQLVNILGETVRTMKVSDFETPAVMNLDGLQPGIYILRATRGEEHFSHKITIIN